MIKSHIPLTKREEDIFAYILGYIVDNSYSPTRQEIATFFKITPQGVQRFIRSLEEKGKIAIISCKGKRTIRNIVIRTSI